MAVGTGTTAESSAHTALVTEVDREAATVTYEAPYKTVWSASFSFVASHSLREVGIFDAANNMLMRHLWSVVRGVDNGDTAQVTLKMTAAAGS